MPKCIVCDKATELGCDACALRHYCSKECQTLDRPYHVAECNAQQINSLFGIGKWKKVIQNHASLLVELASTIAQGGPGHVAVQDQLTKIDNASMEWNNSRGAEGNKLRELLRRYNENFHFYCRAVYENENFTIDVQRKLLYDRAEELAKFLSARHRLTTLFSTLADYINAFREYTSALLQFAKDVIDYFRKEESKRSPEHYSRIEQRIVYANKVAAALAALLNGRPWKQPRYVIGQ